MRVIPGVLLAALAAVAGAEPRVAASYAVRLGQDGRDLAITAELQARELTVDGGLGRFVREAQAEVGGRWLPLERRGDSFERSGAALSRIRYTFALAEAASALRDRDTAIESAGMIVAPPSSWLMRPVRMADDAVYRFTVTTPAGLSFACGVARRPDGVYEAPAGWMGTAPYAVFGAFEAQHVQVPGGTVELVSSARPHPTLPAGALQRWGARGARAVAAYYGRFPVARVLLVVLPGGRRAVGFGKALGGGGAAIVISVGDGATEAALARDWVLTHELTHLGLPNLPRRQLWMEEGLATYVESVVRARAGLISPQQAWQDVFDGLPRGQPAAGDEGLDRTPTWGRTYWGGALFWLSADVALRERTGGARGLEHALRAVNAAGGNMTVGWDALRLIAEADRGGGVPVVRELYDRHALQAVHVDVDALARRLGLERDGAVIRLGSRGDALWRSITPPP